jgi:arylsulfatase A-like enzyme
MKRIPILAAATALALAAVVRAAPPAAGMRPNLVIILADDQGWGDLGVTGNRQLRTPNIDSLARDGVTLDRFYVCPVCAPTRAEMLTGRYHPRTGVRGVSTGQERLNTDEATLADAFKAAGYATGAFGKWHNGSQWPYHPNARGFDEYFGFTSGHWGEYFDAPMDHNGRPVRGKGFTVDDFTDHGMAFIEKNRDHPFLCYLAYNTPHSPFIVPQEYWRRFKDKPIDQRGPDGERETVDVTRAALAMCENIDGNVGRLLAHLDRLGLREKTHVLYFSDNGPNSFRWNGGMKGRKGSTDEGGVRSPCFLRWPGRIPAGSVVREIAGAIDLLPTFTSLAGIPRAGTKPLDGVDLSPLLLGTAKDWPERAIVSHWGGRVSVRTQAHRLDAAGALFDMAADPDQTTDIRDRQPEVAAKLAAVADAWRRDMGGAAAAPPAPAAVKGKGKGKGATPQVLPPDDRPYPVGYAQFPRTPLPARDGEPHGGVRRSANAPNCSYFVNWTSPDDSMTWDIDVATTGDYDVEILYAAPEAGSTIEMSFGSSKLAGKVAPAWDPPLITDQDVIPRPPGESVMKDFRPLKLGVMHLEKGRGPLTLRATKVAGREVMQVRGLALTLRTPPKP